MARSSRRFGSFVVVALAAHGLTLVLAGRVSLTTPSDPSEHAPTPLPDPTVSVTELFAVAPLPDEAFAETLGTKEPDETSAGVGVAATKEPPPAPTPEHLAVAAKHPPTTSDGPSAPESTTTTATTTTTSAGTEPSSGAGESGAAPSATGNGGTTSVDELLTLKSPGKPSWVVPPVVPTTYAAPSTAAPVSSNEALAAKVSKDVTTLVAASGAGKDGGQGGLVVNAAHAAARSDLTPDVGIALLVVKTDASGVVNSVSVASCDGDKPGWDAVAKDLGKQLGGTTFKVPPGSPGKRFEVKIQAKYALPSGANPKSPVTAGIEGIGIGGTFDVSDIGQKPKRIVSVAMISDGIL